MVTKVLLSVAIALGAGVGLAPAASADPNPFSNLSCSCQSPPDLGPTVPDQITQGIQQGLSALQATDSQAVT
ncbi:hypothetical protein BB737_10280 [Mycobacterium avium subsp. hominissuis]|uniref:Uncharacterized protein n=1 Tax=Mycobacterium avium subsp. hominissuis TaxID=439334 RepID=A0A2A3LD14_MYCAV|nr:hypothetical protein XV03_04895 [Mycobacterium avium subsp. hominissuis]PBJ43109.1 hypothetical protein BI294_02025 [Mycobacterium avium subsp. hominissuis]PBJ65928.1 hypothetical protein BB737_10280 [Mycobacterium avium subsp. hominissuis]